MSRKRIFEIIGNVTRSSKESLIAVCALAGGYILISALVVFNVEPDSFGSFFDAIYWATVSLIAIVALPAGIITAGYMNEINKDRDSKKEDAEKKQ